MILIVGAGLAGLSTAYHLSGNSYRLYEREPEVGGSADPTARMASRSTTRVTCCTSANRTSNRWSSGCCPENSTRTAGSRLSIRTRPIPNIRFK